MLKATLASSEYVPADMRTLFSCLITQDEFLVWESAWKREIREVLPDLWAVAETSTDIDGAMLSVDNMCGVGDWEFGPKQAEKIPREALQSSVKAAETAFFKLSPSGPITNYLFMKQEPLEYCISFVDCLCRAI